MVYRVIIPKSVQKTLDNLDPKFKPYILAALASLSTDPYLGKSLSGKYNHEYSYKVWSYRIVYRVKRKELLILIIHVGKPE